MSQKTRNTGKGKAAPLPPKKRTPATSSPLISDSSDDDSSVDNVDVSTRSRLRMKGGTGGRVVRNKKLISEDDREPPNKKQKTTTKERGIQIKKTKSGRGPSSKQMDEDSTVGTPSVRSLRSSSAQQQGSNSMELDTQLNINGRNGSALMDFEWLKQAPGSTGNDRSSANSLFSPVIIEQQRNRKAVTRNNGTPYQGIYSKKKLLPQNVGSDYGFITKSPFVALGEEDHVDEPGSTSTANDLATQILNNASDQKNKMSTDTVIIDTSSDDDSLDSFNGFLREFGEAKKTKRQLEPPIKKARVNVVGGTLNIKHTGTSTSPIKRFNEATQTQAQSVGLECINGVQLQTFPVELTTGTYYVVVGPFHTAGNFPDLRFPGMDVFAEAIKKIPGPEVDVPRSRVIVRDVHVQVALNNIPMNDGAGVSGDTNRSLNDLQTNSAASENHNVDEEKNSTMEKTEDSLFLQAMDGDDANSDLNAVTVAKTISKDDSICGISEPAADRTDAEGNISSDDRDGGDISDWNRCTIF